MLCLERPRSPGRTRDPGTRDTDAHWAAAVASLDTGAAEASLALHKSCDLWVQRAAEAYALLSSSGGICMQLTRLALLRGPAEKRHTRSYASLL